mmetsp:Transcript_27539/g.33437  ORF Transcript_27539/g.33437 Transcript_27539/m.33437 type:complete len:165 (+) Transcript_27539:1186-1680(+)
MMGCLNRQQIRKLVKTTLYKSVATHYWMLKIPMIILMQQKKKQLFEESENNNITPNNTDTKSKKNVSTPGHQSAETAMVDDNINHHSINTLSDAATLVASVQSNDVPTITRVELKRDNLSSPSANKEEIPSKSSSKKRGIDSVTTAQGRPKADGSHPLQPMTST